MMQNRCSTCPRPVPDTAFGCLVCAQDLAGLLDQLAAVLPELDVTIARQDRLGSGGARPAGAEVPLPYRPQVAERAAAIRSELSTWARTVHDETGHEPVGVTGSALARYLGQATGWARYRQQWPEFHAALRPLFGSTVHLIDRPAAKIYLGPCRAMNADTGLVCWTDVLASPGAVVGQCRQCGAQHEVVASRAWLLQALRSRLARPDEIARVLAGFGEAKIGYSTIMAYIAAGWLLVRGEDGHGRPLYRVGDALEIRAMDRQRKHRRELFALQRSQS